MASVGLRTVALGDQCAGMRLEAPPRRLELALKIPPARRRAAWVALDTLMRHAAIRPPHHHSTASRPVALLRGALWRSAFAFAHEFHRGRNDMIAQRRAPPPLFALQQVETCRPARRRVERFDRTRARLEHHLGLGALGISAGIAPWARLCVVILAHVARIPHRRQIREVPTRYGLTAKLASLAVNRNPDSRTPCKHGRGVGLRICRLRSFGLRQCHGF